MEENLDITYHGIAKSWLKQTQFRGELQNWTSGVTSNAYLHSSQSLYFIVWL